MNAKFFFSSCTKRKKKILDTFCNTFFFAKQNNKKYEFGGKHFKSALICEKKN